jgi:septum site-determining protein MinC
MVSMLRSDVPEVQDLFPVETKAHEPAIELKGSVFTLPVLCIRCSDLDAIDAQLAERLSKSPQFFENAPIVVDLEAVRENPDPVDFDGFLHLMRARRLFPVGVQNGSSAQNEAAMAAGLAVLKGRAMKELPKAANWRKTGPGKNARTGASEPDANAESESTLHDAQPAPTPPAAAEPIQTRTSTITRVIHQPVRSGQRVIARGGDLIVLAAVNAGAEIIAEGNIHVYAPLRGRALAGVSGDTNARIFCQQMEAELVAIAGNYRVFEDNMPRDIRGKTAQVYLDGEQLIVEPLA